MRDERGMKVMPRYRMSSPEKRSGMVTAPGMAPLVCPSRRNLYLIKMAERASV